MRAQVCWPEDDGSGRVRTACGLDAPRSFTALDREVTCDDCKRELRRRDRLAAGKDPR